MTLEKTLMLGKTESSRRRSGVVAEDEIASITKSMDMNFSKLRDMVKDREAWHVAVQVTKSWTYWLNNNIVMNGL